jgi:hypothetical protein
LKRHNQFKVQHTAQMNWELLSRKVREFHTGIEFWESVKSDV